MHVNSNLKVFREILAEYLSHGSKLEGLLGKMVCVSGFFFFSILTGSEKNHVQKIIDQTDYRWNVESKSDLWGNRV